MAVIKGGFEIVKRAMLKELMKRGDDGIMLTLPKNELVDLNARITMDRLIKAGIDPESLTSPDQVLNVLENINNQMVKNARVISADSAEGKTITDKLFGKKGEVVDMTGKKMDTSQGIMGGKSVKELMESGQVQKGTDDIKISDKITEREMFKNSSLNKKDSVTETISYIKTLEPMDAMKEANSVIGRKGKYKNLTPEESKKILQDTEDHIFERDIPIDPEDMARGGRAGLYTGGMVDVEPNLSDIGHGSDALMARTRLVSPDGQATTSTGLNYLLAEDNDNIRVPFENGGDFKQFQKEKMMQLMQEYQQYLKNREIEKKQRPYMEKRMGTGPGPILEAAEGGRIGFAGGGGMSKRAFLKLIASLGGTAAAFKSGILGLGEGTTKKAISETVKQAAGSGGQVPPYFLNLVKKIKTMGDDVTEVLAYKDKQKVTKYKDYELTEDLTTGEQTIQRMKVLDDGSEAYYGQPLTEETYMSYKPGKGQADETMKGKTPPDEYEEGTALLRSDRQYAGEVVDESATISDDVIKEGTVFEDTLSEFGKADGGRIGFAGGGGKFLLSKLGINSTTTRFLEKVFGKQKFQNLIENDPEMHRGLLEVAEMFRSKDKSGLVEYMQNFLPKMSKKELESFVVGSGDNAGIEGQLIRLGSGRDYKNKIELVEEANNLRKLKDFDVDGVSKNAEGGRIEMKGGGDALKAIIKYYANKKGVKGSDFLKDINPKVLPEGIENILGPEHLKMLKNTQTDYLESLLNIIKSDKKLLNNLKANTDEAIAQAPIGMEDFAKEITESIKRSAIKGSRFDRMKVYDKIDIDDAIVDVEQMIKNRRVKESDGRALNAFGGIQTMLGE